jgi:hypothetical protein
MESTLTLPVSKIQTRLGIFLGYGGGVQFGDPAWDSRQVKLINQFVDSGLRKFYFPPPVPPNVVPHDWSFMRPVATLNFPVGVQHMPLPDDFGGMEGEVSILAPTSANTQSAWAVQQCNIGYLQQRYAELPQASGRPLLVATTPIKGTSASASTRYQMWVFPQTDTQYTFQFQYYLLGEALTVSNPYFYGGMAHSDTLLQACILMSEVDLDDVPETQCVHYPSFMERLAASVHVDSRNKPQWLGYNRDRSDWNHREIVGREWSFPIIGLPTNNL